MSASFTPAYRVPRKLQRMRGAIVWLLVLVGFLVVFPVAVLLSAHTQGVTTLSPLVLIVGGGIAIAGLSTYARYNRPTRMYGPMAIASSAGALVYLLLLYTTATIQYSASVGGREVFASINYGGLVLVFTIVPILGILGGILTTFQDRLFPGKRLLKDYPAT